MSAPIGRHRGCRVGLLIPVDGDPLAVVLKLPGETCNINCHYCYEKRKPYPGAAFLEPSTVESFLALAGDRPLSVMLHGGEPLLAGRARIGELIAVLGRHSRPVSLSIQTNGILLNDKWIDFFEEHCPDIEIGISLDGDAQGNEHRVDYRGRPTYGKVTKAFELLERRGWDCGVIVVVSRKVLGRADEVVAEMLRYPSIKNVKLSPCLDYDVTSKDHRGVTGRQINLLNPGAGMPGWATTPSEYADFLAESFASWRNLGAYRRFLLEPFVSIVRALNGQPTDFTHFDERKDPFVVTVYPDGRIGTCDELEMPAALLGHVDDAVPIGELLGRARSNELFGLLESLMASCDGCRVREVCRGGSLPDRVRLAADEQRTEYCNARGRIIDSAVELMGGERRGEHDDSD